MPGMSCRFGRSSSKGLTGRGQTTAHFNLVEVFKTHSCRSWCFPKAPLRLNAWQAKPRASTRAGACLRVPAPSRESFPMRWPPAGIPNGWADTGVTQSSGSRARKGPVWPGRLLLPASAQTAASGTSHRVSCRRLSSAPPEEGKDHQCSLLVQPQVLGGATHPQQSWSDSGSHPHSSSGQVQARGQGAFQPSPARQTPLQKPVSRQVLVGRQGLGRSRSLGTTARGDKVLTQPWSSPEEQQPPSPGTCPITHPTSVITVFGPETHRSTLEKLTLHSCPVLKRTFLGHVPPRTGSSLTHPGDPCKDKFKATWWESAKEASRWCLKQGSTMGPSHQDPEVTPGYSPVSFVKLGVEQTFLLSWGLCTSSLIVTMTLVNLTIIFYKESSISSLGVV